MVEGWNRHEAERTEVLRGLQEERQAAELTRSKQQEVGAWALKPTFQTSGKEGAEMALELGFQTECPPSTAAVLMTLVPCPSPCTISLSGLNCDLPVFPTPYSFLCGLQLTELTLKFQLDIVKDFSSRG